MKKKIFGVFLFAILLLALTACGKNAANQWQEQYDLGQKYLLEEDYEAAIVAFTAAIEIDPNEPAAYVGRGDAYMMSAATDMQTMEESYEKAAADYETALSLYAEEDDTSEVIEKLSESYLALAEYYETQGDDDMARTYYEKAYELTGDEEIAEKIETIGQAEAEKVEEEEEPEEQKVPPLDEEPLVDEDAIEYVAKYTTDLYDNSEETVIGTANLYVCSEKEAILCVESLKEEEIIEKQLANWDWVWLMRIANCVEDSGSERGWFVAINWWYDTNDSICSELIYTNYDEIISHQGEAADSYSDHQEYILSSEESLTEKNGKMYIQIKYVISDEYVFDFYTLENYETLNGWLTTAG
ncbi:MAG: tetratricopeptide repeat protein [Lachnospiraceae bacterium]|nr:tetratricopeptide repeat protein [Lachnospiraceae bacterium]